jgi:hypothetical protein
LHFDRRLVCGLDVIVEPHRSEIAAITALVTTWLSSPAIVADEVT